MKKLIFILLCFPIIVFAKQTQESKNIETFKRLCQNAKDVSMRPHYCQLLKKQRQAEAMLREFESNKLSG